MSKREGNVLFLDIAYAVERIEKYSIQIVKNKFEENLQVQDAIIRNLQVIGEAIKLLSTEERNLYPEIDFKGYAGLRDRIVHQFF